VLPAFDRPLDQPGPLEHLHVLRRTGERHRKRLSERPDREVFRRQPVEHVTPGVVSQDVEEPVQRSMFNHLV
jgi:hypothetical protein